MKNSKTARQAGKYESIREIQPAQAFPAREELLAAYTSMLHARLIDNKIIILYKQNKCHFHIGAAGHEGVQIAAAQFFRPGKDWLFPYYRDLAFCLAMGMTPAEIFMCALNKRDDPNSHGRQMPMHWGSRTLRMPSQSSPTGTQYLQAVGCALALRYKGISDEVVYVSSGESACSQGDFHEALNWAARESLPVVFVVENNRYAISVPIEEQLAGKSVYKIVAGYDGLERFEVDGTDYLQSCAALKKAHARACSGLGPSVVEAHVVRLQSHSISDNHLKYRSEQEIAEEKVRCPVLQMEKLLISSGAATKAELESLEDSLKSQVDRDAELAEAQADCLPQEASEFIYAEPRPAQHISEQQAQGEEVHMVDALNHALAQELAREERMCVFGQDVAHNKGGVFTVTAGLTARFGKTRVFNAPLAESSIIGVAVGMAMCGLKPVAEIQFGDYIWTGMNQLRNELALMYYRSAGEWSCPAVIRVAVGGYIHGGPYHSQNIEATFAHFPGLFVVYPSNATDAFGLLKASIRARDPVLFLEHKGLYRQVFSKGREGGEDFLVPIGKARVALEGSQATIITWGALLHKSLMVAAGLSRRGISVEVIDLRTIVPLDLETIYKSVRKTGRVLIAHEDVLFMGFGAEVAAQISEHCFEHLDAPVMRLGMDNVPAVGHSPALEEAVLPQNTDLENKLEQLLSF